MTKMRPSHAAGHESESERAASGQAQPRSAVIAYALLLGGAVAAMFLVGHAEQGNVGVFLLCAGTAMICCPPLVKVRLAIAVSAAAFLLCSGLALLPARFFHVPVWRRALAAAPDLPLPQTVSASPDETVFWLAVLTVTVLTGLFALTQPVRSRTLLAFALAGTGVCGVYAALSILAKIPGWMYAFSSGNTFGFFPNRNHTAALLVTGSVLSIGILAVAFRQRRRWALNAAVATLTLCVSGLLFFSESRGGVVFLFVGLAVWMAGLGRHLNTRLLITVLVVVLTGGVLFLKIGSTARDRLLQSVFNSAGESSDEAAPAAEQVAPERPGGEITTDGRVRIYRDTLEMIRDLPVTGSGLGTFAAVFPPYRLTSANRNVMLHPESDWLMVAAETGLPALLCLGCFIGLILRGWRPAREHPYWPLRWGCLAAAGAAALHGCVDVPIHRVALGWWVLVLAALALQPGRAPEAGDRLARSGWLARTIFVLGGLFAVLLGGILVRAEWFGGRALPPYAADIAQVEVARTFKRGDLPGATDRARQAIGISPLASPLYYQLGLLLIREEDTDAEIDRAFKFQRLLNPWTPLTPRLQAVMWMPLDPARSAPLFIEALEREERLQQISHSERPTMEYWKGLVQQTDPFPLVQSRLLDACAGRSAEYTLAWLEVANPRNVKEQLPRIAGNEQLLTELDADQRKRFLSVWKTKGDPDTLQSFLQSHAASWSS